MVLIAWAVVGVVIGAMGSEVLRAKRPKLIGKVEGAAKHFVDSICSAGSDEEKAGDAAGDENAAD